MNRSFEKCEILIKISMIIIFAMSVFIGVTMLNLEPNLEKINSSYNELILDKSTIVRGWMYLGISTVLFEFILYKLLKLVKQINKDELISKDTSKILKSMGRVLGFYIVVTIFTGHINNISIISNDILIYKNEFLNKVINSWAINTGFDAIVMGIIIIIAIVLLQVLVEGVKIKEENDLTV